MWKQENLQGQKAGLGQLPGGRQEEKIVLFLWNNDFHILTHETTCVSCQNSSAVQRALLWSMANSSTLRNYNNTYTIITVN